MDKKRGYAASFLEESFGFARGDLDPSSVPTDLVEQIAGAVQGSEGSRSDEPELEAALQRFGRSAALEIKESRGFVLCKERWPRGAKYSACLTHDVDNLSRPLSHVLQRRGRFGALDLLLAVLGLRNLYDNIGLVSDHEASRNLRSSFYLLTTNYDLGRKSSELNALLDGGWDIGLHGDLGTHDSRDKMAEALSRFVESTGIKPSGVREHFLKFDYKVTWDVMERAGFVYDATVGNTDRLGFRIGLCTPFHPPDGDWQPRRILELPLVLMDATLWGYLKRTEEEGLADFENLRRKVSEVNGLFSLLWHPEAARMRGGRLYPALLDRLLRDGCFIGSARDVSEWWLRRGKPLILEGDSYRMEDAPAGLSLRFKSKGGLRPAAEGGAVSSDGDGAVVTAAGGPLAVKVV